MAKLMTRERQKQWLDVVQGFLIKPVELPAECLYNPDELRDLQVALSERVLDVSDQLEKLASELEAAKRAEWATLARKVQKRVEEGLAVMTFVSIVVMRQKHELAALRRKLEQAQEGKKRKGKA